MALIHEGVGESVLFPRNQFYTDFTAPPLHNNFDGCYPSTAEMDHRAQFVAPSRTTYDSYPVTGAHAIAPSYYESSKNQLNCVKAGDEASMPRPTPSASPSSMSQAFDPASSVLSSTSGASAQSAASSVGGSPYARPTQQMPFQEKWSTPLEGLGISAAVANNDFFGYDPSRHDFVGEYEKDFSSSLPCVGASTSSISLASASQEFSFPYSASRSELPGGYQKDEAIIDTTLRSLREIENIDADQASVRSLTSSTSTCGPPPTSPNYTCNWNSPTRHGSTSPLVDDARPVTPHQSLFSSVRTGVPDMAMYTSHDTLTSPSISPSTRRHQEPFFSQSSGRFVAPLNSSCSFSYVSVCFIIHSFAFRPFGLMDAPVAN